MKVEDLRYMFFTGKGGVGKTSLACATAIRLADEGKRVLLICTDPASNLEDVLNAPVGKTVAPVRGVDRLFAVNILPDAAAEEYRDRVLIPLKEALPPEEIAIIRENLSGACTTEVASFDEFSRFISGEADVPPVDLIIFDTAPTGHTLRLLALPAAWSDFTADHPDGASCLGPTSALKSSHNRYATVVQRLQDTSITTFYLVSRPDKASLREAARTRDEMHALGMDNQVLYINGVFTAMDKTDMLAVHMEESARRQLEEMPPQLKVLSCTQFPLLPYNVLGPDKLRSLFDEDLRLRFSQAAPTSTDTGVYLKNLNDLVDEVCAGRTGGLIMTMGKGGVGKTLTAAAIAILLAERGMDVLLTTTDPAAHIRDFTSQLSDLPGTLTIEQIDPKVETQRYLEKIMQQKGKSLDEDGKKLLWEDLQSPCTEEVAVFHAFSRAISQARRKMVVMDTAPTGHTLLLLDTAGSYHRDVMRHQTEEARVRTPYMSLQDADLCKIILVTLPETTPMHEAASLQSDLARAGIKPYAWMINQCLSMVKGVTDPVLRSRANEEMSIIQTIQNELADRTFGIPFLAEQPLLPTLLRSVRPSG